LILGSHEGLAWVGHISSVEIVENPLLSTAENCVRPGHVHRPRGAQIEVTHVQVDRLTGAGPHYTSNLEMTSRGTMTKLHEAVREVRRAVAFIVFAFRQGMKVRPLDPDEQPPVNRNVGPPPV
jgi:hypothetical protein